MIMSCSSHLPNDCSYFRAEFIICQYISGKFGGCANSAKRILGDFYSYVKRAKLNSAFPEESSRRMLDFHTLKC